MLDTVETHRTHVIHVVVARSKHHAQFLKFSRTDYGSYDLEEDPLCDNLRGMCTGR